MITSTIKINMFSCRAKETYLIPPKAEFKGNTIDPDDVVDGKYYDNQLMLKECEEFKPHWK
jgi:hypothetical protein